MLGIYWLLVVNQPQWCKWGQVARVWSARIASYRDVCGFWVSEVKPWALRGWGTDLKMYLEPHTEVQHFYTKVLFLACIYQCYPSGKVRRCYLFSSPYLWRRCLHQMEQIGLSSQKILTSHWLKSAKVYFCHTVCLMRISMTAPFQVVAWTLGC